MSYISGSKPLVQVLGPQGLIKHSQGAPQKSDELTS